jgi:hypothetical protein
MGMHYRYKESPGCEVSAFLEGLKMPLLDFYGDFARATHSCRKCGWTGLGSAMSSGESFGEGVDKHCPQCGERWGFVQYPVFVVEDPPADWKSKTGRVAD